MNSEIDLINEKMKLQKINEQDFRTKVNTVVEGLSFNKREIDHVTDNFKFLSDLLAKETKHLEGQYAKLEHECHSEISAFREVSTNSYNAIE